MVSFQTIYLITSYMWWDILIARHPPRSLSLWSSASSTISTAPSPGISTSCKFSILNFKELDWKTIVGRHSPANHHRWVCQSCNIGTAWRNHHSYNTNHFYQLGDGPIPQSVDTSYLYQNIQEKSVAIKISRDLNNDLTDFFKLCEIKVSLCNKEMTKAYDPLFRNTRENRVKIQKIFTVFHIPCFVLQFRRFDVAEWL